MCRPSMLSCAVSMWGVNYMAPAVGDALPVSLLRMAGWGRMTPIQVLSNEMNISAWLFLEMFMTAVKVIVTMTKAVSVKYASSAQRR